MIKLRKYLTLKKDYSIKLKSRISKFNSAKYIFLPVSKENFEITNEVKKESIISDNLVSPISGVLKGFKYCQNEEGEILKCLTIENDYKETFLKRNASRKNIANISLETTMKELEDFQLSFISDKLKKGVTKLILNGIEDEPYVANEIFLNKEYTNELLETLDYLREKKDLPMCSIAIKNNDRETIDAYTEVLGTYPNVEMLLVPDYYLLGKEEFLKEYLNIQEEVLFLKPSELLKIYDTIKRRRQETEKIFTISGNAISNPQVVMAKLGSPVKEIINELIELQNSDYDCMINGIMTGKKLDFENMIVTKGLDSILFMKKDMLEENSCISCGKCLTVCPKNCNPKKCLDKNDSKSVKDCIECGLCSYICPSFINLRKRIAGVTHE